MSDLEALEELAKVWRARAEKMDRAHGAAKRCRMDRQAEEAARSASTYRTCIRDLRALIEVMRRAGGNSPS